MKIVSWNVNGLRSVAQKGFLDWLKQVNADIVCLQEVKAGLDQLPWYLTRAGEYHFYLNEARKKGYSGVAVYTKKEPNRVSGQLGFSRFDQEGRMLLLEYPEFILINLYLPHGGRGKENLPYKLEVYRYLLSFLKQKLSGRKVILAGDFNVAHQEIDLARPKENQNSIMFTPEERKQIDQLVDLGFIDSFRHFHQEGGHYTWWPYGFQARKRNLGWRIDYIFVSSDLKPALKSISIQKEVDLSDHSPLVLNLQT